MKSQIDLVDTLNSIHEVPKETMEILLNEFEYLEFPTNYNLRKIGQVNDQLYYVEKGIIRHYLMDNKGKEINSWFSFEGSLAASFRSFTTQTPSLEGMQVIETCTLRSINYKSVYKLMDQHHNLERLFRLFTEHYYIEAEERIHELKTLNGTERYLALTKNRPDILQRISLNNIASFLGITKETLSRIRAKQCVKN